MKTYFLGLALLAFVSAVAIQSLHARTTTPPVYVVVEIDEITDAKGFEALCQAADATAIEVQFEDGRYFARTENVTAIDGSAPKFFTLIAFDNVTKAKAFVPVTPLAQTLRQESKIVNATAAAILPTLWCSQAKVRATTTSIGAGSHRQRGVSNSTRVTDEQI